MLQDDKFYIGVLVQNGLFYFHFQLHYLHIHDKGVAEKDIYTNLENNKKKSICLDRHLPGKSRRSELIR